MQLKLLISILASSLLSIAVAAESSEPAKPSGKSLNLEAMSHSPGVVAASMSPDGTKIAIIEYKYGHVVYVSDVKEVKFESILGERQVDDGFWRYQKTPQEVIWLNNDVIVVNYNMGATSYTAKGKFIAELGEHVIRQIGERGAAVPMVLAYTDIKAGKLARVNALTGQKTRLSFPVSGKPVRYAFDKQGEPRVITTSDSTFWNEVTTFSHWYKPAGEAPWRKMSEFKLIDDMWTPLYVPEENNTIVVSSRAGRDTSAIFTLDTTTGKLGKMMAGYPEVDVVGYNNASADGFERVTTSGLLPSQIWFNPEWSALQKEVDLALPKRINTLSGNPQGTILVYSYGDVDSGSYYLLDAKDFTMRKFGSYHANIDPADMRPTQALSYASFDGLSIPAYLTLPKGGVKALPTVIMIHGGPQDRDTWQFDTDVQLLASRGYAVLQPQFRGSTGFGRKFEQAGYGQWGLAMQDDITAGVEHLIKQGIADPQRICIFGASYGGYAALWGLVKTPQLYQCGVSFAGVSDIEMLFNGNSDLSSTKVGLELVQSRIGDPKVNKQEFSRVSPLKQAARIVAPVLIMHGHADKRVPIEHGKKMVNALKAQGKKVEWLAFDEEGHGLYKLENKLAYFKKFLDFLDLHIGPGAVSRREATAAAGTEPGQP